MIIVIIGLRSCPPCNMIKNILSNQTDVDWIYQDRQTKQITHPKGIEEKYPILTLLSEAEDNIPYGRKKVPIIFKVENEEYKLYKNPVLSIHSFYQFIKPDHEETNY